MIKAIKKFIKKKKENLKLKQRINRLTFIQTRRSYNSFRRGNCFKGKKQEINTAGREFKIKWTLDNIIYLDCNSEDYKHLFSYANNHIDNILSYDSSEPVLIFLKNGTKETIQRADELAGTLNSHDIILFILDCYAYNFFTNQKFIADLKIKSAECLKTELNYKEIPQHQIEKYFKEGSYLGYIPCIRFKNIDDLYTTNSTGILEPQQNFKFTVFDCEEVFEKL